MAYRRRNSHESIAGNVMLIKSTMPNRAVFSHGGQKFIWRGFGDCVDVPFDIVEDRIFQRQMEKGNLVLATKDDEVMYVLAGGKITYANS